MLRLHLLETQVLEIIAKRSSYICGWKTAGKATVPWQKLSTNQIWIKQVINNERKNEVTHWHLALAMQDPKERTTLDVVQKAQMYSRRSKRKEPFSKTLNPPDKEISSRTSIQAIIPPFIWSVSVRPLCLCSLDRPSKSSISNNRNTKINISHNTEMKAKISYNIPNGGWAHIHAQFILLSDFMTLPTSDRPHREVVHHSCMCGSPGTRPMIAKRRSITLWCSDHTKNQFTCVHLCTCVDFWSHRITSPCPWGTRFADDYKWTSIWALTHKLQFPKYNLVKVLVPSG